MRPSLRVSRRRAPAAPAEQISNLHYTIGGPYFAEYRECGYADTWLGERAAMLRCDQRQD